MKKVPADVKADEVVDVRGLTCPMPVLTKILDELELGQTVEIIASDFALKADISSLLQRIGHEFVELREVNGMTSLLFRKR